MFNEFLTACLLMGVGIGTDAALATALMAALLKEQDKVRQWILGVTLTHTLFPMAGYLLALYGVQAFPLLEPALGIVAFLLIAAFVISEFSGMLEPGSEQDKTHNTKMLVGIGLVLSVSWDALWSGPAKSAQVVQWGELAVWSSFFVVGLIIAFMTSLSYRLASRSGSEQQHDIPFHQRSWRIRLGLWFQFSIFAYFAVLALSRYTLNIAFDQTLLLISVSMIMAVIMLFINYLSSLQEAQIEVD